MSTLRWIAEALERIAGATPLADSNPTREGYIARIKHVAGEDTPILSSGGGGGGATAWGDITGTLSAQTDLQAALDALEGSGVGVGLPIAISDVTGLVSALGNKQPAGSYLVAADLEPYATSAALTGYQPAGGYLEAADLVPYALSAALAGYQPLAAVLTGTTASFTTTLNTKLGGIATGATANDTDANLKARANHTGEQAISTITGLQGALDGKQVGGSYQPLDSDLTAIAALTTTAYGRSFLDRADAAAGRTLLGLGTAATTEASAYQPAAVVLTNTTASFTTALETKLNGIATSATANATDAQLRDRATHTGTQAISTILTAATARLFGRITASGGAGEELTGTQATTLLDAFTSALKGLVPASGGGTLNYLRADGTWGVPPGSASLDIAPVKYDAAGAALGPTIADFFTASIALEAASIYEIECHAYFLKTTAGTMVYTWAFSSAPTMARSSGRHSAVAGFTNSLVTTAEVSLHAVGEALTALAHAATASLTTAVRHSATFTVRVRTNAATTIQLRGTANAGTFTPQPGSYMRARKIA